MWIVRLAAVDCAAQGGLSQLLSVLRFLQARHSQKCVCRGAGGPSSERNMPAGRKGVGSDAGLLFVGRRWWLAGRRALSVARAAPAVVQGGTCGTCSALAQGVCPKP